MDQLRGSSVFLVAAIGLLTVWGAAQMFSFQPDLPETSTDLAARDSEPAFDRARQSTSTASRSAAEDRIRRLQAVIRSQRDEIQAFRAARAERNQPVGDAGSTRPRGSGGLLAALPDLSAITGAEDTDGLSTDQMADRLDDIRGVAIELREQLEAAESIVEMQMAEIEDLKSELDLSRERAAELAADRAELDDTISRMLDESRELEAIATRALISLGPAAAPVLLPLLEDERLHVRTWVRDLMGSISGGPEPEPGGNDR